MSTSRITVASIVLLAMLVAGLAVVADAQRGRGGQQGRGRGGGLRQGGLYLYNTPGGSRSAAGRHVDNRKLLSRWGNTGRIRAMPAATRHAN